MPMDRKLYPANWGELALSIKTAADWRCLECGRPCRRHDEAWGDLVDRISGSSWESDLYDEYFDDELGRCLRAKFARFTLTVAHLNHEPADCRPENLKALCSVCHLRYDAPALQQKRRRKKERLGQLTLPVRDLP